MKIIDRKNLRERRHVRSRKKLTGTADKPRAVAFRSLRHIYLQAVDDIKGLTLVSVSSIDSGIAKNLKDLKKVDAARQVGREFAAKLITRGIKKIVFDRAGYLYHGRIKALADGAREGGLQF